MCVHNYACMCTCVCVRVYVYVCMCTCVCVRACECVHLCMLYVCAHVGVHIFHAGMLSLCEGYEGKNTVYGRFGFYTSQYVERKRVRGDVSSLSLHID